MKIDRECVLKRDLPDQIGTPFPRLMLHCNSCQAEYSAHRGDYFQLPDDHAFFCCGAPLRLVRKITVFQEVTK